MIRKANKLPGDVKLLFNRCVCLFCMVLLTFFTIEEKASARQEEVFSYYRGRVIAVEEAERQERLGATEQTAQVRLINGPFRGEVVEIKNTYYPGDPDAAIYLADGMEIIVAAQEEGGELTMVFLQDLSRDRGLYLILALFFAALVLVGKKKGLRALIALLFTLFVVIVIILPLILRGLNPIIVSAAAASGIIIVTLPIIGGINSKSVSAIAGTITGVTVAGAIAYLIGEMSSLTGFTGEEARALFFMEQPINIRGLLFAGIIIGSLGAATDVGMSVASAVAELSEANKNLKPAELSSAAMNIGRDIIGTMSNTLVLAYAGGTMPLLLILMGQQISFLRIMNMDLLATEIVRGLASSIGLIVSIPITAAIAGALMGKTR